MLIMMTQTKTSILVRDWSGKEEGASQSKQFDFFLYVKQLQGIWISVVNFLNDAW